MRLGLEEAAESQFLGFTFRSGQIKWHPKTLRKFKQRIRELTNRNWGVSMRYQCTRPNLPITNSTDSA